MMTKSTRCQMLVLLCANLLVGGWSFSVAGLMQPSHHSLARRRHHEKRTVLSSLSDHHDGDFDEDDHIEETFGGLISLSVAEQQQLEMDSEKDWLKAELTLMQAPDKPDPFLDPDEVAMMCVRSLQYVDYPTPLAGLERCFSFFTIECRNSITARQGAETVESFCKYGVLSPALQPFMGATSVALGGMTYTPAKPPLRGALASFSVDIVGPPISALQYKSGMHRNGIALEPERHSMVIRLEQQRRPPLQGCWMVREIVDKKYTFAGDLGNTDVGA